MEVGSRVLCTDSSIKDGRSDAVMELYQMWVRKGAEYTIREVLDNDGIVIGVLLDQVINDPIAQPLLNGRMQEPAFRVTRFQELHDDMAESVKEVEVWMN